MREFATAVGDVVVGMCTVIIVLGCVVKLCSLITRWTSKDLTAEQVQAAIPGSVLISEQDQQETIFITEAGRQELERIYMDHEFHQWDKRMRNKKEIA